MPSATTPVSARDISVVVPVHRAGTVLHRCLGALAATEPRPAEIIVVADGEGDGTWRVMVDEIGVRVIELPEQRGAAAARNAGARAAAGSVVMFVDADVVVAPGAVGEVIAALNENPELAAVFGSYDDEPGAANFIAQYKGLLNHFVHQHARPEASTFWTALGAVRKDVFFQIGGLDETQRLEDIEFGYRLRDAGLRIGVRKTLLGKHLKRWTPQSLVHSDFFDRAIPWTELMLRHRRADNDLNLDTASRISVVCVFVLLTTSVFAWWWPLVAGAVAILAAAALLWLNSRLYAFFFRKRGTAFLVGSVLWHWLYFFYGGISFAVGLLRHATRPAAEATRVEAR